MLLTPALMGLVRASKTRKPNLFTSGKISDSYWLKEQSTASDGFAGPSGALTAQRMLETAVNNQHLVTANLNNTVKPAVVKKLRFTGTVKPIDRNVLRLGIFNGGYGAGYMIYFNILTGTVEQETPVGFSASNVSITPDQNGFFKIAADFTTDATAGANISLMSAIASNITSYLGEPTAGFYCQDLYLEDIT